MSKRKLDLYLDGTIGFICPHCEDEISVREVKEWIDDYKKKGAKQELEKVLKDLLGLEKIVFAETKDSNSFYALNSLRAKYKLDLKDLEK